MDEDKKLVLIMISAADVEQIPELKKQKIDESVQQLDQLIVTQNNEFYAHRDFVQSKFKKSNWIQILEVNKQKIPKADDEVCYLRPIALPKYFYKDLPQKLDLVADILTFGALESCSDCAGQLVFSKNGYVCTGRISEWAKCEHFTKEPPRRRCQIPSWLTEQFAGRKVEVQHRALKVVQSSSSAFSKTYDPDAVYV